MYYKLRICVEKNKQLICILWILALFSISDNKVYHNNGLTCTQYISMHIDDTPHDSLVSNECIRCKCSIYHNHQTFHCHHPYCMKCSAILINESLLLLNVIPHCLICDNPLNMYNIHQTIQSLLLPAYQINNQFSEYNIINALIVGFIRTKIDKSAPNEIISSISDFYKLLYCKKIICPNCDCIGYIKEKIKSCSECSNGYVKCNTCSCTGYVNKSILCTLCNGSGNTHSTHNVQQQTSVGCAACSGALITSRCYYCSGTRSTTKWITKTIHERIKCSQCNGRGVINWRQICEECNGDTIRLCINCKCGKCKGNKYLMLLDLNKFRNKQLLCYKCNFYKPQNVLLFLNNCHHTFCFECCSKHISNALSHNRFPNCLQCKIKTSQFKIFGSEIDDVLNKKFEKLLADVNRTYFKCIWCSRKHCDTLLFKWTGCDHKYGEHCVNEYVSRHYEKRFNKIPKCSQCHQILNKNDAHIVGFDYDYYQKNHTLITCKFLCTLLLSLLLTLLVTAFIASQAFLVFNKANHMIYFSESFTINGECILLSSYEYHTSRDDYNVYEYQIYDKGTNSLCYEYRDKQPVGKNYTLYKLDSGKLKYETDIDYIIPCYTNKYCDKILLDVEYEFENYGIGWTILGGILVTLIAIACCLCGLVLTDKRVTEPYGLSLLNKLIVYIPSP